MGIINRKEKDYDAARRAYLNALKYNKGNESVQRDLCQLQLHVRDFDGFKESRRQILMQSPSNKENWVALAAACFLAKDYNTCQSSCESIMRFEVEDFKTPMKPVQIMEVVVLRVRAYEKLGQFTEAIDFMNEKIQYFIDTTMREDLFARLYAKKGVP